MSDLWLAAASRLPEEAARTAILPLLPSEVNTPWHKATPLVMATAHAGHSRLEDVLLDACADPNKGQSMLQACCDWHFEHLIRSISGRPRLGINRQDDGGATAGYAHAVRSLLGRKAGLRYGQPRSHSAPRAG